MNLIILDDNPADAVRCFCETHLYWHIPEALRVMRSALSSLGVSINVTFHDPGQITNPVTRDPEPEHPWAVWASSSRENFLWVAEFAEELCLEYKRRFKTDHCDLMAIRVLGKMEKHIPEGKLTAFPQDPLPQEYRQRNNAVAAYRDYYACKANHGHAPFWPKRADGTYGLPPNWYFDLRNKRGLLDNTLFEK